jgi:shikimate dehydrogenase
MKAHYAVIGDPIAHSLSPEMMSAAFAACNIDATYESIRVNEAELDAFMMRAEMEYFAGFNVTTPLKEAVVRRIAAVSDEAKAINGINTVKRDSMRFLGDNTDGAGFIDAVESLWQWKAQGASVLLLGSGPAARAIAYHLREEGASRVSCWSRNEQTAKWIGPSPETAVDLLVSTLPAGAMVPEDVLQFAGRHTLVFDVNYSATRSPIPPSIGSKRSNGLPMLLHQGARSFTWWTGQPAPLDAMRRAIGMRITSI